MTPVWCAFEGRQRTVSTSAQNTNYHFAAAFVGQMSQLLRRECMCQVLQAGARTLSLPGHQHFKGLRKAFKGFLLWFDVHQAELDLVYGAIRQTEPSPQKLPDGSDLRWQQSKHVCSWRLVWEIFAVDPCFPWQKQTNKKMGLMAGKQLTNLMHQIKGQESGFCSGLKFAGAYFREPWMCPVLLSRPVYQLWARMDCQLGSFVATLRASMQLIH